MSLHHRQDLTRVRYRTLLAVGLTALLLWPAISQAEPNSASRRGPVAQVVERVKNAVVNIHSERTVQAPSQEELLAMAPSQNRVNGMGTGIIIDPRGYIITNQHVVEDVNLIRIRLCDGGEHVARVVARDGEADLALLKIDAGKPLPVMPLGTAQDLMVGEDVVAIGNAYGYHHTVTTGVVSALKRDVSLNKDMSYRGLIQTSASINPGNSGGPLLNHDGELVGVNVAIRAGAQGIAFAIPVDQMLKVASGMMSVRRRGGLTHGITYLDRADTSGDRLVRSLVVERVEGPASQAGIQKGDVVVKVADQPVTCGLELERAMLDLAAGAKVAVAVRRDNEEKTLELVLKAIGRDVSSVSGGDLIWQKLGLRLAPVGSESVSRSNPHLHGGLSVSEVRGEGVAGKAGIQKGDVLVGLHQWETVTMDNVLFVLSHPDLASFNPLRFYVVRAGQVHRGWLQQVE